MILPRTTAPRRASKDGWRQAIDRLAGGSLTLLGLWGDPPHVHMATFEEASGDIAVLSYACKDGTYPSVGGAPSAGDPARTRDPRSCSA